MAGMAGSLGPRLGPDRGRGEWMEHGIVHNISIDLIKRSVFKGR